MNEQKYDNRRLTDYLLGALPEADAEQFDELSFTDDEFAAALQAAENDLVDNYARGELATATRKKFETHYLASPLRREKVAFAEALQSHAKKHPALSSENATFAESKPKRGFKEMLAGVFSGARPPLQWGFALAALAFLFFGGWLWRENARLRSEMSAANANRERLVQRETELAGREKQLQEAIANQSSDDSESERELARIREERAQLEEQLKKQTQQQQRLIEQQKLNDQRQLAEQRNSPPISTPSAAIASFVLAPSLRGGSRIQTVSIPARAAGVSATLELEADEYNAYRAVLRSSSGEKILWQSGRLKSKSVGGDTRLSANFPANLLQTGIYSIELNGIAADGAAEIVGDYSFRVVR